VVLLYSVALWQAVVGLDSMAVSAELQDRALLLQAGE
jgi:hypothetical protein